MTPTAAEVIAGWKAWCPANGVHEIDAVFYHAERTYLNLANMPRVSDFQEVAEHYAENHCGFADDGKPFESIEIYVRDTLSLEIHAVTVRVDYEPTFTASIWVTPR